MPVNRRLPDIRPGWRRECTHDHVAIDDFCDQCMAFRSAAVLTNETLAQTIDLIERDKMYREKRATAWRAGTMGH